MTGTKQLIRRFLPIAFLTIILLSGTFAAAGQPADLIASLDPQQGLVQIRPADSAETDWRTVTEIELVEEGAWVRTGPLGLAYLTYFEGIESEILPDTLIQVSTLSLADADSPQITVSVFVGDVHHRINQVLDAESRYEVDTPSAFMTVRGTDFWSTTKWWSDTYVNVLDGRLQVAGKAPDGMIGEPVEVNREQSVMAHPEGQLGAILPLQPLPLYPPEAPLAPPTCGNMICDPGEETLCPVDCVQLTSCGDRLCDKRAGENPITCAADCVPPFPQRASVISVSEPCAIQTSELFIPLRVGPGYNRSVRMYLPANQLHPVIGQIQLADNTQWWQITVEGAPQAWVLQSDVNASGDCAIVAHVEAPPVLAPAPQPLPTQPAQPVIPLQTDVEDPTPLPEPTISFVADKTTVKPGECVTIRWDVEGVSQVYYQGQGVVGHGSAVECVQRTATFTLQVILLDSTSVYRTITITTP
ncbi:MAG: FecR domain-containing protein [Anaerolineae bacterium]|nr:FecR domain-containing protein [Anaerolineae bacterium]